MRPFRRRSKATLRDLDEVRKQRAALFAQQTEHEQRLRRLSDYEGQLRARAATLESETQHLVETEAEIDGRRRELETAAAKAQQAAKDAELQRESVLALREQAEARDAEVRQRQLAAELELQELAAERAALEKSHGELDDRRMRDAGLIAEARAALAAESAALKAAQRSWLVRPGHWWLRTGVLAVLGGAAAGLAWFWVGTPTYEASAELSLASGSEPKWVFAHEQRLRTPELVPRLLGDCEAAWQWQQLRQAARVRIEADPQAALIRVTTRGAEAPLLQQVVAAAVEHYAAQSDAGIESAEAADTIAQLETEQADLAPRMREAEQKQARQVKLVDTLATEGQRDAARAASDQLRFDYESRGKALAEAQSRLADLETLPVARGNVLPAEFEAALAADEMYQADLKEFRRGVVEYRSEMAVSMLLLTDPLRSAQSLLEGIAGTVAEQRTLQPPPPVVAVLEQFETDLGAFGQRIEAFSSEWNAAVAETQRIEAEQPLADLLGRQSAVADKAREFCAAAAALESGLRGRLDEFTSSSGGGTREVVVVAVLRSELAKLNAGNAELTKVAGKTDVAQNVRLDAVERQLRGLQGRLERRQVSVRQLLQFEADERARREQLEQVSALRGSVQELRAARASGSSASSARAWTNCGDWMTKSCSAER